ncbi:MAG: aldose 1-epimerase family protein [Lachnospiraceae bacterium]|nr:aldose 1-epimerase family protein [Lachnospiraceae bacterium]
MRYFIENDVLKAEIDSHGAELKSVIGKASNREYMWYGNPAYWGRTSPVLFPFVGNLKEGGYIYKGQKCRMTQHGFARDMEFTLKESTGSEIWFSLESNEETKSKYPFDFELMIGYVLDGNKLDVRWKVINKTEEDMHFSIGAHPAFLCPVHGEKDKTGYSFALYGSDGKGGYVPASDSIRYHGNSYETGLLLREERDLPVKNGVITITEGFFDECTYIMQDQPLNKVSLLDSKGEPVVDVLFDTPLIAIWSPEKKNAPFVCIEPWYGRCDIEGFDGELADREYTNHLAKGEEFNKAYSIVFHAMA